eukprot:CAMPEP_0172513966 /NCGR_PEP_ID=MMETSP1066-20121228/256731_1 /TAXON_ID=671091 /ORGANISM="Coscinodiscus wailesii, Strain CCMP2513" /LENGTH=370 /DNA_ID=CAMNT_0013294445 /DNA_START=330 /DNA_END=1442 /DNA_ORIENTATION=+
MATSTLVTPTYVLSDCRDRHDAACALLSWAPIAPQSSNSSSTPEVTTPLVIEKEESSTELLNSVQSSLLDVSTAQVIDRNTANITSIRDASENTNGEHCVSALLQLKESQPCSQNGLDALADIASAASISDSPTPDEEPLPRRRMRSVSNPEGMEKWDLLLRLKVGNISPPVEGEMVGGESVTESAKMSALMCDEHFDPDELLRQARGRLLDDMHASGEKGSMTLPHCLEKYKEVYNKNGRIGIYTPAERAAIIARFNGKRTRRVWNKKIRYNCRKNLADRRLRVKGRFVKRSSEEAVAALAAVAASPPPQGSSTLELQSMAGTSSLPTVDEMKTLQDKDMGIIDTSDPEAGFEPTEDQPYRRTRRHTIT